LGKPLDTGGAIFANREKIESNVHGYP